MISLALTPSVDTIKTAAVGEETASPGSGEEDVVDKPR